MVSAAILLSRQSLRPCGADPWVRATQQAVLWAASEGHRLHTSLGMTTWELVLALASLNAVPVTLHLASSTAADPLLANHLEHDFGLSQEKTRVITVDESTPAAASGSVMLRRDQSVVEAADVIIPISVRPGGHMAALIAQAQARGKRVIDTFVVPYPRQQGALSYRVNEDCLNPELTGFAPGEYVVHWTRAANRHWPDERPLDFYSALVASYAYPRDALATLRHILTTRRIIASGRHMPRAVKTVSFTACEPIAMIPHMRWRARWREMSFEPYGIGIRTARAQSIGIESVVYVERRTKNPAEQWKTQTMGIKTDWRTEREFRHRGNLDLTDLPLDDLIVFCRFPREADALRKETGLRVVPMELTG
ncbi:MAG: hypothetical protein ABIE70_12640 [bacterium]